MIKTITNDKNEVVFKEELLKLQMNCSFCGKEAGFVYSSNITHGNTLGWSFRCKECQK